MPAPKKRNIKKINNENYLMPSLSGESLKKLTPLENSKESTLESINNAELQKALDKWLKQNIQENKIMSRDLTLLKSIISEYLDSYLLLGYSMEGQRIVIQSFNTAKDKDALMEFLKNIFIQQQQNNFLDFGDN
jgi:hypothetical protein